MIFVFIYSLRSMLKCMQKFKMGRKFENNKCIKRSILKKKKKKDTS